VRLGISGRDTRGRGGAEGTVDSVLVPIDGGGTRVQMATELRFSGQAAQLGRPAVVQDMSNRLVDQFAACLSAQLQAESEPDRAVASAQVAEAVQRAQKPISAVSLIVGAIVSAIKRLLGRPAGRGGGSA
jgi:uncharacterized protein